MPMPRSSRALAIFGKLFIEVEESASAITLQLSPEHGLSAVADAIFFKIIKKWK